MYVPPLFREERIDEMAELMRRYPLATLITVGADGLIANHVPMLYDAEPAPFGTLRGHVARANPQWRMERPETGALAVFQGPQAYVSPSFYPSKRQHPEVVPTWNYAVVHAHGRAIIHDDAAWLRRMVTDLTEAQEAAFDEPWHVSDAPAGYIDGLLKAIVGVELRVTGLEGKWKASQNRAEVDQAGVVERLARSEEPGAREMAEIQRGRRGTPMSGPFPAPPHKNRS